MPGGISTQTIIICQLPSPTSFRKANLHSSARLNGTDGAFQKMQKTGPEPERPTVPKETKSYWCPQNNIMTMKSTNSKKPRRGLLTALIEVTGYYTTRRKTASWTLHSFAFSWIAAGLLAYWMYLQAQFILFRESLGTRVPAWWRMFLDFLISWWRQYARYHQLQSVALCTNFHACGSISASQEVFFQGAPKMHAHSVVALATGKQRLFVLTPTRPPAPIMTSLFVTDIEALLFLYMK